MRTFGFEKHDDCTWTFIVDDEGRVRKFPVSNSRYNQLQYDLGQKPGKDENQRILEEFYRDLESASDLLTE